MKKVLFKNGKEIEITDEVANILHQRIIEGCKNFQCFTGSEGELVEIINVSQITYIK